MALANRVSFIAVLWTVALFSQADFIVGRGHQRRHIVTNHRRHRAGYNPPVGQSGNLYGFGNYNGLRIGFYDQSCPAMENTVFTVTKQFIDSDITLAASLLRMHFHDCFVEGCDGSILINSTADNIAEKQGFPNINSIRGFFVIDAVKAAIEAVCPGVVSCADILTMVARDAVSLIGGPYWLVPTGRKDGRISLASEANTNLPSPLSNLTTLITAFARKGLDINDLVVLSGAHTIGVSHCTTIQNRLYNFTGKGDADPSLDRLYANQLRGVCKPNDAVTTVPMDPTGVTTFDNNYYKLVVEHRGLFTSDGALLSDTISAVTAVNLAGFGIFTNARFLQLFGIAMQKMGTIDLKLGQAGEIRTNCAVIN